MRLRSFRLPRAISQSLALHGALIAFVLLVLRTVAPPDSPPIVHTPPPLEITLIPENDAPAPTQPESQTFPRPKGAASRKAPLRLGLVPRTLPLDSGVPVPQGPPALPSKGNDAFARAETMDLITEGRNHPFHAALWSRVNAQMTYPEDLSQKGISGSVTIQLSVDHRGTFTGEVVPLDSDDPLLQALSLATVIHALRDPLPPSLWLTNDGTTDEAMPVLFRFDYAATRPGEVAPEAPTRHFKNLLNFQRTARVDAELNRTLDRWLTRYIPPVFPIPGGFYVDVVRLIRLIRSNASDEPDFYRKREDRIERARERWLSVIHPATALSD